MQQNSTPPYSPFRLMEQGNRYPMDLPEGLDESHYCSSCGMDSEGQGAGAVADDTELQDSATSSSVSSNASQMKHLHKVPVLTKHRMTLFVTRKTQTPTRAMNAGPSALRLGCRLSRLCVAILFGH